MSCSRSCTLVTFDAKIMGVMFYSATEINLDLLQVKILREKSCYDDNAIVVKSRDGKTLGHVDYLTAKALVQIMNT